MTKAIIAMNTGSPGASLLSDDCPDPEFDPKPANHYFCPICHRVLRSPVQTYCGHRFCQQCLMNKLRESDPLKCPIGEDDCEFLTLHQDPIQRNFMDDFSARRDINNFKVRCLFKEHGCEEKMKYKDLRTHLETCKYIQVPCVYREFGCPEVLPKAKLDVHKASCEYRPARCQHCNTEIALKKLRQHIDEECPNMRHPCKYCGKGSFNIDEIRRHYMEECPKRPVPCPFENLGCATAVPDDNMRQHERESVEEHLRMVPRTVNGLEAENRQLREKIDQLRQDLVSARQEAESMATKVKSAQKQVVRYGERVNKLEEKLSGGFVDQVQAHETRLVALEGHGRPAASRGGDESDSRTTAILELRINEIDDRVTQYQSISYDGILIWKIDNYSTRKQEAKEGRNLSLYSQPFYTSKYGYKMRARAYLNGDGAGKHNHLSLFFVIMRGEFDALLEWPFKQKVTLMLLDQKENAFHLSDTFRPDVNSSSFARPTTDMNIASGCPKFAAHEVVEGGNVYLRDNCIFVKVVVDTSYLKHP